MERRDSTSPSGAAAATFSRLGEGEFHRRLGDSTGVVVVLFTAPQCGSCRVWRGLLPDALSGLADAYFEVDVAEATGVARYFGIFHLPTIYLYRDGLFHAALQCEARAPLVREQASRLLAAPAAEEP